jgi:hypothetical protein
MNTEGLKNCALLAGAGAVVGAWDPVMRALKPFVDFPLTVDGANSYLARLVYLARWFSSDFYNSELHKPYRDVTLEHMIQVKQAIASELAAAEAAGEITHRVTLEPVVRELILSFSTRFMVVTTNWDTVVPNAMRKILRTAYEGELYPQHIHGSVADPSTLYLPSEITQELYRKPEEDKHIGTVHGNVWRNLEQAQRVILYGLSIDPLDAELGQTLAAGWSRSKVEMILIVNPHHSLVAHRVNLLLDRQRDVRVFGLNPETLKREADYTIWRHKPANPTPPAQ